jgi:hypothetical protein
MFRNRFVGKKFLRRLHDLFFYTFNIDKHSSGFGIYALWNVRITLINTKINVLLLSLNHWNTFVEYLSEGMMRK